jgi:multiple sugar transport system permease protein
MIALVIFPALFAVAISLARWNLTESEARTFIGLANYVNLLKEARFWEALARTAIFTTVSTALSLALGMILALLLNRKLPAKNLFRSLLIVPMVITPVVVGLTWRFMYNPELGMINFLLDKLGFEKIAFLGKTTTSLISVIVPIFGSIRLSPCSSCWQASKASRILRAS